VAVLLAKNRRNAKRKDGETMEREKQREAFLQRGTMGSGVERRGRVGARRLHESHLYRIISHF
jgi:hypothetical protein